MPENPLDSLLPLLDPKQPELHKNAAIVEVAETAKLIELAVDPKIRPYLIARLCDTAALVDPGHAGGIAAALLASGHTPKCVEGVGS